VAKVSSLPSQKVCIKALSSSGSIVRLGTILLADGNLKERGTEGETVIESLDEGSRM
jgi:hypothetical protein